ncbi:PKD domain-containing protein [Marivirga salinae]|uniref:PKD domain-containing protein n=1 Tax=Marivirga salinarum TaxID=3059078 RepID=A0AA51N949_9BACT|nr:PKD domain-containing protein [Marivirga sp. BDSF4-3]WMN10873.1 PKD domain-containing protein [Marivirga sp. BDSF4-3]
MRKYIFNLFILSLLIGFTSCNEEFVLEEAPAPAEANFEVNPSSKGENYVVLSNPSDGFIKKWDFGNGASAEGSEVEAYFPFEGEYEVTLTVYSKGGSVSSSETISIANTDPTICNVEFLELLTGGCDQTEGKTWVIDAERSGHFGVGPPNAAGPDYYAAGANEKAGGGLYNDEYTFILNNYQYIQETNGDVYLNPAQEGNFPGAFEPEVGDRTAPYEAPENINYSISEDEEGNPVISFNNNGFIGYNTGVNTYTILSISENEMFIRFNDASTPDLSWFHRLIRKGYAPIAASFTVETTELTATFTNTSLNAETYLWEFGDGATSAEENPSHTYAEEGTYEVTLTATGPGQSATVTQEVSVSAAPKVLPFTFEENNTQFGTFGGTVFNVVDNPDPSGVNTSSRVGEFQKGTEFSFAGLAILLDEPVDFSENTTLSMKIWSPVATNAILKMEVAGDPNTFTEQNVNIPVANEWVELTFDFSGAQNNLQNLVIFADTDNNNGGTFYIDDIGFATESANEITLDLLTGEDQKAWKLKEGPGAFGVGPEKGSDAYFPNGADISGDRPCLFNDEFIFKTGGQYEYNANGDIYAETYMGIDEGCTDDTALDGTDAEAWGPGKHSFSLTPATETEPAFITVRGTGAFIALPKAYNGGEYTAAPPNMDAAVTYEVFDYTKDASGETLSIGIDVAGDGSVWWNFVLVPAN